MPDDAPKPEPIKFPVVVTVNSVRVEVILTLRPGVTVLTETTPLPVTPRGDDPTPDTSATR